MYPLSNLLLLALMLVCLVLPGCSLLSQNTASAPASVRTHKIVRTAYSQIGKKYRSGGASPQKGFDCSGLVWWSYSQHGIKVPRITADQARAGRKVTKKAARPGDILVFSTSHSPRGLHTGIYAGNRKFIHSPSSGKNVCVETLADNSWWSKKLVSIRRIGN
ncbi:MAG: C40 family peptidase [Desulfovibrio sp.]|nr:C40 family peptidase [Desulfovibrio sp.]